MAEPSKMWLFANGEGEGEGRGEEEGEGPVCASGHIWQLCPLQQHLLRHDAMGLYLRACFTRWTTLSRLPSRARITLGKKERS